jgi:hypothetical protein
MGNALFLQHAVKNKNRRPYPRKRIPSRISVWINPRKRMVRNESVWSNPRQRICPNTFKNSNPLARILSHKSVGILYISQLSIFQHFQ